MTYIAPTKYLDEMYFIILHGVMVNMLASRVVDHGFESQSGQTKDYEIGICCFSAFKVCSIKEIDQRLVGSESGCQSEATCLSADCCFSKLAL